MKKLIARLIVYTVYLISGTIMVFSVALTTYNHPIIIGCVLAFFLVTRTIFWAFDIYYR